MKKILLSFLSILFYLSSAAQVTEVAVSAPFETTYPEYVKLLPLENGNLALIRLHEDNKFNFCVYDANHKEVVNVKSKLPIDKLKDLFVLGAIELSQKGLIKLFFKIYPGKEGIAYVANINTSSGNIESVEEITRNNTKAVSSWGLVTDGIHFDLAKSENGKYYALYFKNY